MDPRPPPRKSRMRGRPNRDKGLQGTIQYNYEARKIEEIKKRKELFMVCEAETMRVHSPPPPPPGARERHGGGRPPTPVAHGELSGSEVRGRGAP